MPPSSTPPCAVSHWHFSREVRIGPSARIGDVGTLTTSDSASTDLQGQTTGWLDDGLRGCCRSVVEDPDMCLHTRQAQIGDVGTLTTSNSARADLKGRATGWQGDALRGYCRSVVEDPDMCLHTRQAQIGDVGSLTTSDSARADLRDMTTRWQGDGPRGCCRSVVEDPDMCLHTRQDRIGDVGTLTSFELPQSLGLQHKRGLRQHGVSRTTVPRPQSSLAPATNQRPIMARSSSVMPVALPMGICLVTTTCW
jgi:hypothetical protein